MAKETRPRPAPPPGPPPAAHPPAAVPPAAAIPAAVAAVLAGIDLPDAIPDGEDYYLVRGDRTYKARGVLKNAAESLKVMLRLFWQDQQHMDVLDLVQSRARRSFARDAHDELGIAEEVVRKDIGLVTMKLEEVRDEYISKGLAEKEPVYVMDPAAEARAIERLKAPGLMTFILESLDGFLVGERVNKQLAYLGATSRLLEDPLAIIVQSSTAAGKTALMDSVLSLMPDELIDKYSALTQQSLYYQDRVLSHRILALSEEEGASKASYSLKLLQSEGKLIISSTSKDPVTGKLAAKKYEVKGPVMIFTTTTKIEIDPELMNRCVVLAVDEGREQTRAIHRMQREAFTAEGSRARRKREAVKKLHQDMQRLLRQLEVRIPFAKRLTFPDHATRTRRDHAKYLTLIRAVALLHQHQREVKCEKDEGGEIIQYIDATAEDVEIANTLADEAFGRSLDELAPQTRRVLDVVHAQVGKACAAHKVEQADYRFRVRDVRGWTGLGHSQVHHHLERLVELEYVLAHRGRRGISFEYELLYRGEGRDGATFMMGLLGDEKRKEEGQFPGFQKGFPGSGRRFPGSFRPLSGTFPGGIRTPVIGSKPNGDTGSGGSTPDPSPERHTPPTKSNGDARRRPGAR